MPKLNVSAKTEIFGFGGNPADKPVRSSKQAMDVMNAMDNNVWLSELERKASLISDADVGRWRKNGGKVLG